MDLNEIRHSLLFVISAFFALLSDILISEFLLELSLCLSSTPRRIFCSLGLAERCVSLLRSGKAGVGMMTTDGRCVFQADKCWEIVHIELGYAK